MCQAGEAKNAESLVEWVCNEIMAAKPSDPVLSPPAKRKADASERVRDTELAAVLSKTEIMILNFHQSGNSEALAKAGSGAFKHGETSTVQSS